MSRTSRKSSGGSSGKRSNRPLLLSTVEKPYISCGKPSPWAISRMFLQ
jgi:hypothetical protein